MRGGALLIAWAWLGCHDSAVVDPYADVDRGFRCRTALDVPAKCAACIEAECCDEAITCGEDLRCKPCVQPGDSTSCDPPGPDASWALIACQKEHCSDVCPPPFAKAPETACETPEEPASDACVTLGPRVECNPVTNEGCADGAACNPDGPLPQLARFVCLPTGNVNPSCALCGYGNHDFCQGGLYCTGRCTPFCCSDDDCGNGRCDLQLVSDLFGGAPPTPVGLCVEGP